MERSGSNAGSFPFFRLVPFAGMWLLACFGLSVHWTVNPQYQYGWFVPMLALYAGLNRWRTRPLPGAPRSGGLWLAAGLATAVFPTWLFSQPNPDWPLVNWLFTAEIAGITLATIAAVGGQPWLRHFFFPVVLIFTAVPWPDYLEAPVTQGLMRAVAGVAVGLLELTGVGALQHGNLIEVATGVVGVDEACSGIRSLQGALMASLFLGELFRFDGFRRAWLLVASLGIAFVTNVLRAGFLAWTAAHASVASVERWHDPAGSTILLVCVGAIFAMALFLGRKAPAPAALASVPAAQPLPAWFVPGLTVWLGIVLIGTELWYYDSDKVPESPWRLAPPAESTALQIPPAALATFRCDRTTAANWSEANGARWLLYFFEWNFGPAFSRVAAQMHRPEICLPAGGRELQEDRGIVSFPVAGFTLSFHAYSFRQNDELLFVYHGIWQMRTARGLEHGSLSFHKQVASLQSVLWRERAFEQQVAELAVTGYSNAGQADAALQEILPKLLIPR
jgi:exosortase